LGRGGKKQRNLENSGNEKIESGYRGTKQWKKSYEGDKSRTKRLQGRGRGERTIA